MTRDRAGLESRLGEISAEAQELRVRLSDLEMKAADREAAHSAMQDRSRELEADNRRLAEERDRDSTLASELRAALEEREAACQEQARVIAARDAESGGTGGPGPAVRDGSTKLARPRCSRSGPDRANWKRRIDGWARSGTAPRPWRASSAPRWPSARPRARSKRR